MPVLSLACHLPHNAPHIPSRYNNEQTTKQTKAINNSYIYIYISHVNVTQTVPDISPLMPMHQDPLLVLRLLVTMLGQRKCIYLHSSVFVCFIYNLCHGDLFNQNSKYNTDMTQVVEILPMRDKVRISIHNPYHDC